MKKSPAFVTDWFKFRDEKATRAWSGIALDGNSQHGTVWLPSDAGNLEEQQIFRNSVALSIFVQPRIQPFPRMPRTQKGDMAGGIMDPASTVCYRSVMTVGFEVPFHDQLKAELETGELDLAHTISNQVSRTFGHEISAHDSASLDKTNAHVLVAVLGLLELPSYQDVGTSIALEIWVQVPPEDLQSLVATCGDNLKSHLRRKQFHQEVQANAELTMAELLAKFNSSKGNSNEPH